MTLPGPLNIIGVAVLSYLLGSIPFGYILVHLFHGEDVRASGSGNIGATNVARKSPALGVLTLLLDATKGVAAVLLARILFPHQGVLLTTIAALFAIVGHMFPVWLKFRGGKGVATSLGSFLLLAPKSVLCMIGVFAIVVAIFRYVSLGSVVAVAAFPVMAWVLHDYADPRQVVLMAIASLLILWRHWPNFVRLMNGSESRLGAKPRRGEGK